VLDTGSRVVRQESRRLEVPAGERRDVVVLGALPPGSPVHFVDARLEGADGALLAQNLYWLPAEPDVLDWEKSEWFYTPTSRFADLTALTRLPPAPLEVSHRFRRAEEGHEAEVTLHNPGPTLAFFVELAVVRATSGELAVPVRWDDNYVSLLPGERRTLRAVIPAHALGGEQPALRWQGINVPAGP
jgi:exo-1,4-beta-D-glucosaminidase